MSRETLQAADPALMRRLNRSRTLRSIKGRSVMTLTALVAATGLTRRTVEEVIAELVDDGWVSVIPADRTTGRPGRPARSFRFCHDAGHVLGVDVSAHRAVAIVADLDGAAVAREETTTSRKAGRAERLAAVRTAIDRALARSGVEGADLHGAAAGTYGIVDRSGRVTLCPVLPEWQDFSLGAELERFVGRPVLVENGVNLAAVAEHRMGAAAEADSVIWALVGRSFAAGIILDGRLYRGHHGAAGEFGWTPAVDWEGILAHPLSQFGSPNARAAKRARTILAQAREGEPTARAGVDEFADRLAAALAGIVLAYDPQTLVIGGPAAAGADLLLPALTERIRTLTLHPPCVRATSLGEDAAAFGAVCTAVAEAEKQLLSPYEMSVERSVR